MSLVSDTLIAYLPAKRKYTPSKWIAFNAPCCHHNGTSADTRSRGGLVSNPDGSVTYHCFNCGYKASWQPGRPFSYKLRKLMTWMFVPDDIINKVALAVLRENEGVEAKERIIELPTFSEISLPEGAVKISELTEFNKFSLAVLEYMASRSLTLSDTDYYWSPSLGYRDRLIIPFYYENKIVGWTARTVLADKKPKYLSEVQVGFVYGLDDQHYEKEFVIVCEGQLDAVYINGCSIGGSEIADTQALLLNRLHKRVIVVPDRDQAGKKLVEEAIARNWAVSMPEWPAGINDIGDAANKYGRVYALYSIVQAAEDSPLKIRLRAKKWFT